MMSMNPSRLQQSVPMKQNGEYGSFLQLHHWLQKQHYDSTADKLREDGIYRDTWGACRLSVRIAPRGYADLVARNIRDSGAKDILEIGPAEGVFAKAILGILPDVRYSTLDFCEGHVELQNRVLKKYIDEGRARVYLGDAQQMNFADGSFDFAIANEVLDDLPATLVRNNGTLQTLMMRFTDNGIGTEHDFFPIEECEDRKEILAYVERYNSNIGSETTVHLGVERCVAELSRVLGPSSHMLVMDYMSNVDGVPDRDRGLQMDFVGYRRSNITFVVDRKQLKRIAEMNGFTQQEFLQIPCKVYDNSFQPSAYNYFIGVWQKR